jgi:hypothetical protein
MYVLYYHPPKKAPNLIIDESLLLLSLIVSIFEIHSTYSRRSSRRGAISTGRGQKIKAIASSHSSAVYLYALNALWQKMGVHGYRYRYKNIASSLHTT